MLSMQEICHITRLNTEFGQTRLNVILKTQNRTALFKLFYQVWKLN